MLFRLLGVYLRPYVKLLLAVGIFQFAQSIASLFLPSLNADIIDNGIAKGDIGHIWAMGALMLAVTLIQVICALCAVYFGAKTAMSLGRDLRAGYSIRCRCSPNVRWQFLVHLR